MLTPIVGHEDVRSALSSTVDSGTLPASLLIHGPPGVGKQRLGLWLAQRLSCESPRDSEPCHECRPCRLVLRLEHPDVQWFFPMPRPRGGGGSDRMIAAVEEDRAEALTQRRTDPFYLSSPADPVGLYLAHVHAIRRAVARHPSMGSRRVVLVGGAENLVPQESSPEAANAFLKLLEEPPEHTLFVLTASEPDALLPTMRSRLSAIRLRALDEDRVTSFLVDAAGADPDQAMLAAHLAAGSIGRALGFLDIDGDPGPLESLRSQARAWLTAAAGNSPIPRFAAAHARSPSGARGEFDETLTFLGIWLRDLAAAANDANVHIINIDGLDFLRELADRLAAASTGAPDAIRATERARSLARGNVNPQLTLAWLLPAIHTALTAGRLAIR